MLAERPVFKETAGKVKCLVWDLDNTLWNGTLLEDRNVSLRKGVTKIIRGLDSRGILQSIASRNDYSRAMAQLERFGIREYFLCPQINWDAKSASLKAIADSLNIGIDTLAFVDDQPFELDEVSFNHPRVLCINAADTDGILDMPAMHPRFITDETKKRRLMYIDDFSRKKAEEHFKGPRDEFLASLNMVLTITAADTDDLKRAEELTLRTNQLNTTGYTYSYEELDSFRKSPDHLLLIADLHDKYGEYGKIGLSLIETGEIWTIKLLLMSCRVMSRGVGGALITFIRNEAKRCGAVLRAEFLPTDVNRMMYMTYKMMHFKEKEKQGSLVILENDLQKNQAYPASLKIKSALYAPGRSA